MAINPNGLSSTLGVMGQFSIYRKYADGRIEHRDTVKNIVTNAGVLALCSTFAGSYAVVDSWAYGHSGVDSSGNTIPKTSATSGLNAQDGAGSFANYGVAGNTLTIAMVIPINSGNTIGSINEIQIGAGSPLGSPVTCYAAQAFNTQTKNNTFELDFQYTITIVNV